VSKLIYNIKFLKYSEHLFLKRKKYLLIIILIKMKKIIGLFVIQALFSFLIVHSSYADPVIKTIKSSGGDYATFTAAITALNSGTFSATGVTFNVDAGFTESITSQLTITATGTSTTPIKFQKSGAGANPKITRTDAGSKATSVVGGDGDAVVQISGTDYIEFDGIDVSASDQGIEYGYYTFKPGATDGCQNVTIKNCVVTMTKGTSAYVIGIYVSNGPTSVSSATGVTVSNVTGRNENVTITKCTIQNVHVGIHIRGYNHSSSPYNFLDQNVIIGGVTSGTGNTIQNYGGGSATASYGVYLYAQASPTISYNTFNNAGGGGTDATSSLYGIYNSTSSAAGDCNHNYNSFTFGQSAISAVIGIDDRLAGTSKTINNNTFSFGTFASTTISYLIYLTSTTPTVTVTGNQTSGTITKTGTSGEFTGYYNAGAPTSGTANISNNNFSNITLTGSSTFNGIKHSPTTSTQVHNIYNNTISNIITLTGSVYGIYSGTCASGSNVYGNKVYTIRDSTAMITGIYSTVSTTKNIYQNKIYNILSESGSNGLELTGTGTGITNVYNNIIYGQSGITRAAAVYLHFGIYITGSVTGTTFNVFYNTVYMDATTTATTGNFGTGCLYMTSANPVLDLRNNIFVNTSKYVSSGKAVALRLTTNATNYSSNSNNNCFYVGTPSTYYLTAAVTNGSNYTTISDWQTFVTPKDNASLGVNPYLHSPTNLYVTPVSPVIGAGTPITSPITVNTDFNGNPRDGAHPTMGAYEVTSNTATTSGSITNPTATTENTVISTSGQGGVTFNPTVSLKGTIFGSFFSSGRTGSPPSGTVNISPYYWSISIDTSNFTATVRFYFDKITDNNVLVPLTLKLLRRDGPGDNWVEHTGGVTRASTYIQANNVTGFSEWALGGDEDNPLPVMISLFDYSVSQNTVTLKWTTSKEINNTGFDVERKIAETNDWEKISFVSSKGNSNSPVQYTYEDKNLYSGKYNYRLKQIDNNGNYEYHILSNEVSIGVPTKYDLSQNYPNPFNPMTKINYDLPFDSRVMILVYDVLGREMKQLVNQQMQKAGYYTIEFNASNFASGIYFYRMITNSNGKDFVITKKMSVIK
jgi:hypothetical protein